jgi:hypothetical protein
LRFPEEGQRFSVLQYYLHIHQQLSLTAEWFKVAFVLATPNQPSAYLL